MALAACGKENELDQESIDNIFLRKQSEEHALKLRMLQRRIDRLKKELGASQDRYQKCCKVIEEEIGMNLRL